jgi:hypothetical protein
MLLRTNLPMASQGIRNTNYRSGEQNRADGAPAGESGHEVRALWCNTWSRRGCELIPFLLHVFTHAFWMHRRLVGFQKPNPYAPIVFPTTTDYTVGSVFVSLLILSHDAMTHCLWQVN